MTRIRDLPLEFRRLSDLGNFLEFIDFLHGTESRTSSIVTIQVEG